MPDTLTYQRFSLGGTSTQPTITTQHPVPAPQLKTEKYKRALYGLGITEVVLGCLSALLTMFTLIIVHHPAVEPSATRYSGFYRDFLINPSLGIWCGVVILTSGILGIRVKSTPSIQMYNANMALSIISAVLSAVLVIWSSVAAIFTNSRVIGLLIMQIAIGVVSLACFVICIVHSAYCCAGVCCGTLDFKGAAAYVPQPMDPGPSITYYETEKQTHPAAFVADSEGIA